MSLRYRKFKVYQGAIDFHRLIIKNTKQFPREFDYLRNQIRRAALSIILNIAEGSAKSSDKDFNRYLGNSLGSVDEAVAGCEVALKENLIFQKNFEDIEKRAINISSQLGGFSKILKNSS